MQVLRAGPSAPPHHREQIVAHASRREMAEWVFGVAAFAPRSPRHANVMRPAAHALYLRRKVRQAHTGFAHTSKQQAASRCARGGPDFSISSATV